ncbi:MAG: T9SS type A sorting domain-containing protein, partial [Bacteroidota bacterium]
TAYFTMLLPYDTNITWFNNGNPIPGFTSPVFPVTAAGSYTVEGAPHVCPLFIQNVGVPLDVLISNCGIGIDEISDPIYISPNPADDVLNIQLLSNSKMVQFEMTDVAGRLISKENISSFDNVYIISVSGIQEGMYNCIITDASGNRFVKKILIAR